MLKDEMLKEVAVRATDLSEDKRLSKKDIDVVLRAFSECVVENLTENKDEKIPLPGIGAFTAKHVSEKSGISTIGGGKEWHKEACDQLKFTISKTVKTLG